MPPPGAVRTSSTKWQDRQLIAVPLNGPGSIGAPGVTVSTVSTTGSPAFGSLTSPPASRKALKACANLVSRNSRSPTACSALAVPAVAGGPELMLPEQALTLIATRKSKEVDRTCPPPDYS